MLYFDLISAPSERTQILTSLREVLIGKTVTILTAEPPASTTGEIVDRALLRSHGTLVSLLVFQEQLPPQQRKAVLAPTTCLNRHIILRLSVC